MLAPERPDWREILREAADTQHLAVLTWQEAQAVRDELAGLEHLVEIAHETIQFSEGKAARFADRIVSITTADEQAVLAVARARAVLERWDRTPGAYADHGSVQRVAWRTAVSELRTALDGA